MEWYISTAILKLAVIGCPDDPIQPESLFGFTYTDDVICKSPRTFERFVVRMCMQREGRG